MTGPGEPRPGGAPDGAWGGAGTDVRDPRGRGVDAASHWLQSDLDRVDRERRERWERGPVRPHRPGERRDRRDPAAGPLRAARDPLSAERARTRPPRAPRAAVRKQSRLGRFVAAYGWRAYAVPVLVVATVLAVVDLGRAPGPAPQPTQAAAASDADPGLGPQKTATPGATIIGGAPSGDGNFDAAIASGALPDGGAFTATGDGTYRVVPGTTGQVGQGTVATYTVEVENGVDTTAFGGDTAFAQMVDATLANPKSWVHDPKFAFRRVDSGTPTFRISLTSQMTVRQDCGYTIQLEGSCFNSGIDRVVLNEARWVRGAISFQGDIGSYRQYMVNHEVGHGIGYDHQPCGSADGLAPVMMQQTYGVADNDIAALDPQGVVPADGLVCRANPWPYPRA